MKSRNWNPVIKPITYLLTYLLTIKLLGITKLRSFLVFFTASVTHFRSFYRTKWQISLPLCIIQPVQSLPLHPPDV